MAKLGSWIGRRRPDGNGHTTGAGGELYCVMETVAEVPTGEDSSCVVLVAGGAGRPGDELDPAPGSQPHLAADWASAQAWLVKHNSSNTNGPSREPCETQSPITGSDGPAGPHVR